MNRPRHPAASGHQGERYSTERDSAAPYPPPLAFSFTRFLHCQNKKDKRSRQLIYHPPLSLSSLSAPTVARAHRSCGGHYHTTLSRGRTHCLCPFLFTARRRHQVVSVYILRFRSFSVLICQQGLYSCLVPQCVSRV